MPETVLPSRFEALQDVQYDFDVVVLPIPGGTRFRMFATAHSTYNVDRLIAALATLAPHITAAHTNVNNHTSRFDLDFTVDSRVDPSRLALAA